MAGGWAKDGAVQEQVDASVEDAVNLAQAVDDMESETMAGFVAQLDEINALADAAPGFVWRLQTAGGDATSIQAFDDPKLLFNMSL